MKPSRERLMARWVLFAAIIALADLAAIRRVVTARVDSIGGIGGGGRQVSFMYDGSVVETSWDPKTGRTIRRTIRPATRLGLCRVWWPAVAGAFLTLLATLAPSTRAGRRLVEETPCPLPRMTTRRWMILVAVVGTEGGLLVVGMRYGGHDALRVDWTPTLVTLAAIHFVAFLPVGMVLLYRRAVGTRIGTIPMPIQTPDRDGAP